MNCYETLFVVKPTLTEEEIAAQITKVTDVLAKEGAELLGTNEMGMRKLAYQVEKNNRGYYTVLYYKAAGSTIQELERNLKINEDIIKFLTVKYSKNKEITQFDKFVAAIAKRGSAAEAAKSEPVVETVIAEPTVETAETVETEKSETNEA